ncbi:putative NAD(P)H dehydrogenase (quinone) FQR1-like 2 [Smittium culicis]|uniref:Putative NAD(P)H dehydrogenase (Quinone) FQR1-like 2 n=1 Tax=Smittium culicis TaxID=133412 RepID=A0A1R1XVE7_9FUNG|nr:putative NAD(P)H dehydrogenase (quinone) FQR1-like 2 [Smittium culicis]
MKVFRSINDAVRGKVQNTPQNKAHNLTEITKMTLPTVFVVYYSAYGHLRVPGQYSQKRLPKAKNSQTNYSQEEFENGDAFMFSFPSRFGTPPAQVQTFIDSTGGLWFKKALVGKMVGVFTGTGDQSGGQESTVFTFLPNLIHQGMLYVPIGFTHDNLFIVDEVVGGSAYGSGLISSLSGQRTVSEKEIAVVIHHDQSFTKTESRYLAKFNRIHTQTFYSSLIPHFL